MSSSPTPLSPLLLPRANRCARAARLLMILASIALLTALGCSRWDMRGKGFGDNSGRWAQPMRAPADESQFSGVDSRARDIERNLGVR